MELNLPTPVAQPPSLGNVHVQPQGVTTPKNTFASIKFNKIQWNHFKKLKREFNNLTFGNSEFADCEIWQSQIFNKPTKSINAQKLFSLYFCFWRFQPQYWQMVQVNKIASKGIQENSSGSRSKDRLSHIYKQFCPSVNFTNILWAAFAPESFCQKITNPNCKHIKATQKLLCAKAARKILVKLTPSLFYL